QVTNPAGAYVDDLSEALAEQPPGPWRMRYHVPLHTRPEPPLAATPDGWRPPPAPLPPRPAPPLAATTDVWRSALRHLMGGAVPGTEYLDVETWELPGAPGGVPLAHRVAAEVSYPRNELESLGLSPPAEARAA